MAGFPRTALKNTRVLSIERNHSIVFQLRVRLGHRTLQFTTDKAECNLHVVIMPCSKYFQITTDAKIQGANSPAWFRATDIHGKLRLASHS